MSDLLSQDEIDALEHALPRTPNRTDFMQRIARLQAPISPVGTDSFPPHRGPRLVHRGIRRPRLSSEWSQAHPSRERSRSGRSRDYRAGRFRVDVTRTTKELREPPESSVWGCRRILQLLPALGGKCRIFLHSVKLINLKMLKINQLTLWHDSCVGSPVLYS